MDQSAQANQNDFDAQRVMGRALLEEGEVAAAHVSEALAAAQSGGHMLLHLVNAGHLTEGNLHDFLSRQPGIAAIDIGQYTIERGLAELVPLEFARERLVMPIDALGKLLTVAMVCPVDTATIAEVEAMTGRRVKAVLCRASELTVAIEKMYPDRDPGAHSGFDNLAIPSAPAKSASGPAKSDIVEKLRAMETLALPPAALQQCDALWDGDAPSVVEVVDFVSTQPALAAMALRTANAEAFGLRGQVGSVALACSILGADSVRTLALDAGRALSAFDADTHNGEAVTCAKACAEIARAGARSDAGMLFAAGLLHSVGRWALAEIEPEFYGKLAKVDRAEWANKEVHLFGLTFAEAGFEMLDAWGLPPALTGAVRDQIEPASSETHRETAAILACARGMAAAKLAGGANPALNAGAQPLLDASGLDAATAEAIFAAIG